MDQTRIPLYEALCMHAMRNPISFHVPGHKYGCNFPKMENAYFQQILKIDATELSGLDDLHSPEGPILEAETLLANLYNVKNSFFLVNGSTAGNLAMVLAVCEEDDFVFVQRNCHKSILHALKLVKAKPIFLEPDFDLDWKIAAGINPETVKEAIAAYPAAKALILTYPNYYGMTYQLEGIIHLAHQQQIPVLVDEAHGAHFIAGELFPPSAVQLGADIVVQSAHKTLPAMTMGSFLHHNSHLVDVIKVIEYLHIFQSSSPSYPIMASLDVARSYLGTYKLDDQQFLEKEIQSFKVGLAEIPGIRVLPYHEKGDPLKITVQSTCGQSGFILQRRLEEFGVFTELADPFNVLFVFPLLKEGQTYPYQDALTKIKAALMDIPTIPLKEIAAYPNKRISTTAISYQEMKKLKIMEIPISEAEGMVAAENVIPYPPGVPLLLEGEIITLDKLESLCRLLDNQAKFQGGSLLKHNQLKVFSEKVSGVCSK